MRDALLVSVDSGAGLFFGGVFLAPSVSGRSDSPASLLCRAGLMLARIIISVNTIKIFLGRII